MRKYSQRQLTRSWTPRSPVSNAGNAHLLWPVQHGVRLGLVPNARHEREEAKRLIEERLTRDREDKARLIGEVEEWLERESGPGRNQDEETF